MAQLIATMHYQGKSRQDRNQSRVVDLVPFTPTVRKDWTLQLMPMVVKVNTLAPRLPLPHYRGKRH